MRWAVVIALCLALASCHTSRKSVAESVTRDSVYVHTTDTVRIVETISVVVRDSSQSETHTLWYDSVGRVTKEQRQAVNKAVSVAVDGARDIGAGKVSTGEKKSVSASKNVTEKKDTPWWQAVLLVVIFAIYLWLAMAVLFVAGNAILYLGKTIFNTIAKWQK